MATHQRLGNLASHLAAGAPTAAATASGGELSLGSMTQLRDGLTMPRFGLGTYLSEMGGECLDACTSALGMGYVMLDTANMYNNEAEVGASLAGRARDETFVVTKHSGDHGRASTLAAIDDSLALLGLEYVDLYLIHNPKGGKVLETWQTMLDIKASGKARAVGVSNFGLLHLAGIKAAGLEMPEVNQ
jgi:diketogulonate reductase-like aldo/keto reductase